MIRQDALASALDRLADEQRISGAILIAQDREVVFEKAYGFANRQLNVVNTLDTKFHIASTTKMFIAMAALVLADQGRIALLERAATYLPELTALDREITIHHLLSHTAGIPEIYEVPNLRFAMQRLKAEGGSLLAYMLALPPLFRPGAGWRYSSIGFILMGYLMERVTGESFEALLKRHVLAPLAMTNTGVDVPRRINLGRASGHSFENGAFVNAEDDELSLFPEAPGELATTVRDLKRWCDALYDCPLVAPETLQRMFTSHARVDEVRRYGYGWYLTPRFRMHGGETPGFRAFIRQYPERRLSAILLFNSDHVGPWTILTAVEPLLMA